MKPIHSELHFKVEQAIMDNPQIREYGIDILEQNGVITLKGTVPTHEVSETVESLAKNVFGVRGVINELEISTSNEPNHQ